MRQRPVAIRFLAGAVAATVAAGGLLPASALAAPVQGAPAPSLERLAGKYDGSSRGTNGDMRLSAELTFEGGALGGWIDSEQARVRVTGAGFEGDKLWMSIDMGGAAGSVTGRYSDGTIEGEWVLMDQSGVFVLTKAASEAGLAGEWDANADVNGQPTPFTLSLAVEGEKVTGTVGGAAISNGAWSSGKLTFSFPYTDGTLVTMTATIENGTLVGSYDYGSGQAQGRWEAKKK